MESEINLMEPELPQLSQMVQKNTERIVRSEKIINRLIMENDEQSRKSRERDEWWENSRREHERDMRDIRETMRQAAQMQAENQKGFQELKERFAETDKRMEEERRKTDAQIRAMFAETDKRMEEERRKTDAQIKAMFAETDKRSEEEWRGLRERFAETDKRSEEEWRELRERFAETDKRMEEERRKTDAQISNISRAFLGSTGHIVEGLMSSSIDKIFKDAGFNLYNRGKNIIRGFADGKKQMEVDAMLGNDEIVIPIEVKADFTEKKVKRFVHRMTMFREFFPECADKEIVAAVAAINYENGADTLARKEGLLVIRVSSDDIFSLDPFDIERLRRF